MVDAQRREGQEQAPPLPVEVHAPGGSEDEAGGPLPGESCGYYT